MSGSESIRGYLVQTLIALLDAMSPEADWHTVMLEADQSIEKVDLVWLGIATTRAMQIKSSKNQINLPDCREWARELKQSVNADVHELVLVGPCSGAVLRQREIDGVLLRPPLNLDLQAMMEQATHRLEQYLMNRRIIGISGIARGLLLRGLISEFLTFSAARTHLSREDFDGRINEWVDVVGAQVPESEMFSDSIRREFARINKTIDYLTKDQFNVIMALRSFPRVRISGVAGSGKTLVAAEKAIRLDLAGFRTLLLCHSVHLAAYLEQLTYGSGIDVFDFSSWLRKLHGEDLWPAGSQDEIYAWTHFDEPSGDQLERALDILLRTEEEYDAVIVDEGQDFRSEWWIVVEAALAAGDNKMLYIFHDDNQALLPVRSTYPVTDTLCDLSKNCRNAGSIFSLVRRFHRQAP